MEAFQQSPFAFPRYVPAAPGLTAQLSDHWLCFALISALSRAASPEGFMGLGVGVREPVR